MFLKLKSSTKTLLQIGYSKSEVANSQTSTTDADGIVTITYNYGSGNSCVECTDEDVLARLGQLSDYVKSVAVTGDIYNITWSDSKDIFVMTTDMDGNSVKEVESVEKDEDPDSETFGDVIKTNYKMSHFSGDDTTKDARLLADKWVNVRRDRDRKLAETDYLALSDNTISGAMQIYRQKLRDVPADNADPDSISWPTKP